MSVVSPWMLLVYIIRVYDRSLVNVRWIVVLDIGEGALVLGQREFL